MFFLIFLFCFFFLCIGLIIYLFPPKWKKINGTPASAQPTWLRRQWGCINTPSTWHLVYGAGGLHAITMGLFPNVWWWLASQPMFWLDQLVIAGVFVLLRKPSGGRRPRQEVTGWGKAILFVLFLGNFQFLGDIYDVGIQKAQHKWGWFKPSGQDQMVRQPPARPKDTPAFSQEGAEVVRMYFSDKELPQGVSPELMVEICKRESGCNHYKPGSRTVLDNTGLNKDNSVDRGILQINSKWDEDLKKVGINPMTMGGNLQAGLYVLEHQGITAWVTYPKAMVALGMSKFPMEVTAPVGNWSEMVVIDRALNTSSKEDYLLLTDEGDILLDGPGKDPKFRKYTKWLRFKSASDRPITVLVKERSQ